MKNIVARAFTLVEFLVILALVAIFAALIVPGYRAIIQNSKIETASSKLAASLSLARIEAVKRGVRVSVCPAGNTTFTACGTNAQWSQGWIVFVDADNNNAIESTNDLVKIEQAAANGVQINTASGMISYDGNGFVTTGATALALSASGCTGNHAKTLNIASSGRINITSVACSP